MVIVAHVIRTAAIIAQMVGVLWAFLAVIYCTDLEQLRRDFWTGVAVIAVGFGAWLAVDTWEHHR